MRKIVNDFLGLVRGIMYDVELNTCTLHQNVVYLGAVIVNGKTVMVFEKLDGRLLHINPSYRTYIVECPSFTQQKGEPTNGNSNKESSE